MGINKSTTLREINSLVETEIGRVYRRASAEWDGQRTGPGFTMVELGDQIIRGRGSGANISAKKYFSDLGINHISIDLNGNYGSLRMDLCSEIKDPPQGDVVTNFGTSEHVTNQFFCWKNIHNMTKENGIMFNLVPLVGHWPKHCNYYYTLDFFNRLAEINDYEVLRNEIYEQGVYGSAAKRSSGQGGERDGKNLVLSISRKTSANEFKGIDESAIVNENWIPVFEDSERVKSL